MPAAFFLIAGQSNATITVGYPQEQATAPPQALPGTVFSCRDGFTFQDLSKVRIGGFTPAFGVRWHALTGETPVFIQAAVGATGMHEWAPGHYICSCGHDYPCYEDALKLYRSAWEAWTRQRPDQPVIRRGYLWNQGEHEEVYGIPGNTIDSPDAYSCAYRRMHAGFQTELGLGFGGLIIVRADKQGDRAEDSAAMTLARIAQYRLCRDLPDLCLVSQYPERCDGSCMFPAGGIHYNQASFNRMGEEAARRLAACLGLADR
jgi:hypothetical protein